MCTSKTKLQSSHINGRPVLQPNTNIAPLFERRNSLKNTPPKTTYASTTALQPLSSPTATNGKKNVNAGNAKVKTSVTSPPVSPKTKSPRQPAIKKPKKSSGGIASPPSSVDNSSLKYSSSMIVEAPGSIAAARREQVAIMQKQRKMKIAHYGRTKSAKFEGKGASLDPEAPREEKRCSFITSNSDPIYIAYHDEEWGVPVHDDNLLFELLVLTGAQVGSDWASVLKKRQEFRDAFSGFDPEIVSKYNEKKITSTSAEYGIELSQIRGAVDNSNRIIEVKKEFGSFDKYLWEFVNNKPIATQYKACNKIPVKTSKSETISKDMVKRGFRYVGPTVILSFMQTAGLTNDHLITCPRHLQCMSLATQPPPAL